MHNTPDPLTTDKAEIYLEGLRIAVQTGKISCATLQRKMNVGYITAVNVVEWLKEQGFVHSSTCKGNNKTLVTMDQYQHFLQSIDLPVDGCEPTHEQVYTVEIDDQLYQQVVRSIVQKKYLFVKDIQRKFHVGFYKASVIVDKLQDDGFVGPMQGTSGRKVLLTKQQYQTLFGENLL